MCQNKQEADKLLNFIHKDKQLRSNRPDQVFTGNRRMYAHFVWRLYAMVGCLTCSEYNFTS